jgi:flagellar motor protein MotB
MTRQDAIAKIQKLLNLANGSKGPESSAARQQADKMMKQHGLKPSDLVSETKAHAFDSLVDRLQTYVSSQSSAFGIGGLFDSSAIIKDVLNRIKQLDATDKNLRLKQVTSLVQGASLFLGDNPHVKAIKQIITDVLREHNINQ